MPVQDVLAYLRSLDWKVWALTVVTAAAILVFCGGVMGAIVIAVCALALVPAVRFGVRLEAEKRQHLERDPGRDL